MKLHMGIQFPKNINTKINILFTCDLIVHDIVACTINFNDKKQCKL